MKKICILITSLFSMLILSGCGNNYIKQVQNGSDPEYPSVTVKGVYSAALKNPDWSHFTAEKGQEVVEVLGILKDEEEKADIIISSCADEGVSTDEEQAFWEKYKFETDSNNQFQVIHSPRTGQLEYYTNQYKGILNDHAIAQKAQQKFLEECMKSTDVIIKAQFVMNVDGETFQFGAIEATFDGGVLGEKNLTRSVDYLHEEFFAE